ncbi:MAG TPA: peptidoglycan-binding domain-containing protein [Bryobacteraceae bacterium]|nr:peptidoglycan-binding domain-containing protein [Bryobacteraceae bacterium]
MFKAILPAAAIIALACSSLAATPAKPHKRHHAGTTAASTTPAHKGTTATPKTAAVKGTKTSSARSKGKIARRAPRSYQQSPTPDRYKEIQQALASKGYYKGEPNGEWGSDSADALKRFQADQSLMPDGKINSLSLIALGLGPKRLTAKSDSTPQTGTPAQPPSNPPQ